MANIYDLTDTWSDGNTTYTSIKMNVTNTASSAASKLIDLQVGSSSLFSVDKDGKIADATELQVDNVKVDGNTVSSTTGNLVLDPYSGSKISLDGLLWPNADGTANQMLQTDGAGNLSWGTPAAGYSNSDVDTHLNTSGAATNQVLSWTGSDYAWTAQTVAFGTSDVDAHLNQSNPTSGYVLSWNGSDYAWVAQTGGSSYGDSDVNANLNTSTATTGQLLSWNGSDYDWITSTAGGGSYADSDVDAHLNRSTASSGEVLSWNGSDYDWVAQTGGGSSYTDADVNTHLNQSSATTGQVLQWDGSDYAWVAQTTAAALGYTAAASTGTVTNTAGTDATLPAATTTNAGLLTGADKTKLDGIEASADVTDTANVTAAGAVMDSELTNEAAVKAINQQLTTTSDVTFNNLTLQGYLAGPATFTIDPEAVGDNTGTVVIAGDLQVDGTTTTINSTTLTVDDRNITVASGAANAAAADGAGLTVDGASATFTYAATGDKWTANKPLDLGANDLLADHIKATGDGTNNGKLDLQCSAGTHAVSLEGPDHSGAYSYTIKMPQSAPAAGQTLQQNSANDQLVWATPASGGGALVTDMTDITLTAAMNEALTIFSPATSSSVQTQTFTIPSGKTALYVYAVGKGGDGGDAYVNATTQQYGWGMPGQPGGTGCTRVALNDTELAGQNLTLRIDSAGNAEVLLPNAANTVICRGSAGIDYLDLSATADMYLNTQIANPTQLQLNAITSTNGDGIGGIKANQSLLARWYGSVGGDLRYNGVSSGVGWEARTTVKTTNLAINNYFGWGMSFEGDIQTTELKDGYHRHWTWRSGSNALITNNTVEDGTLASRGAPATQALTEFAFDRFVEPGVYLAQVQQDPDFRNAFTNHYSGRHSTAPLPGLIADSNYHIYLQPNRVSSGYNQVTYPEQAWLGFSSDPIDSNNRLLLNAPDRTAAQIGHGGMGGFAGHVGASIDSSAKGLGGAGGPAGIFILAV